tara:strand:+ start:146 stop:340 length:195 start_codon:yes stop_codon:yes gene_type:complete
MHHESIAASRTTAMALVAGVASSAPVCRGKQLEEAAGTTTVYLHDMAFGGTLTRIARQPFTHFA